jgi:hypothetical protein
MTTLGLARIGPDPLIDGLLDSIDRAAAELGIASRRIERPADEGSVDVLLIVGFPRAYASFLEAPRTARRIAWFGEPLPRDAGHRPPTSGPGSRAVVGTTLRVLRSAVGPLTRRTLPGRLGRLREAAAIADERSSNLADAIWCSRLVDRVVVTSRDRAGILDEHAVSSVAVPFGYDAAGAGPIVAPDASDRDVPVVVIGSGIDERRLRRGRVMSQVAPAVAAHGAVVRLDGVWGAERDAVLRRTRVVLDVQRVPGNFTGLRFLTAFAAGAVLVTEPLDDPYPFVPGMDHLEAATADLAATVAAVLADEPRRREIAWAGQARLTSDLSMRMSLERVLAAT